MSFRNFILQTIVVRCCNFNCLGIWLFNALETNCLTFDQQCLIFPSTTTTTTTTTVSPHPSTPKPKQNLRTTLLVRTPEFQATSKTRYASGRLEFQQLGVLFGSTPIANSWHYIHLSLFGQLLTSFVGRGNTPTYNPRKNGTILNNQLSWSLQACLCNPWGHFIQRTPPEYW